VHLLFAVHTLHDDRVLVRTHLGREDVCRVESVRVPTRTLCQRPVVQGGVDGVYPVLRLDGDVDLKLGFLNLDLLTVGDLLPVVLNRHVYTVGCDGTRSHDQQGDDS